MIRLYPGCTALVVGILPGYPGHEQNGMTCVVLELDDEISRTTLPRTPSMVGIYLGHILTRNLIPLDPNAELSENITCAII